MKSRKARTSWLLVAISASALASSSLYRHEQRTVSALDCGDTLASRAMPLQALGIDSALGVRIFLAPPIKYGIAVDERTHADKRKITDAAELIHAGEAAEDDVIAHRHVPHLMYGVVGKHAAIATQSCLVAVRQNHQFCRYPRGCCRHKSRLPRLMVTNSRMELPSPILKRHALATVFLVLWLATDGGVRMQDVV